MATAATNDRMSTREIFTRHVDGEGKSSVRSSFVWDADKWIAARKDEARIANEKEADPAKRHAYVEQISKEEYQKGRSK